MTRTTFEMLPMARAVASGRQTMSSLHTGTTSVLKVNWKDGGKCGEAGGRGPGRGPVNANVDGV